MKNKEELKRIFLAIPWMEIDGKKYYHGAQTVEMLGYSQANVANILNTFCIKEKIKLPFKTTTGVRDIKWIEESDYYRMILRSKRAEGEVISDWVCEEVLPSIRQTGGYSISGNVWKDILQKEILTLK